MNDDSIVRLINACIEQRDQCNANVDRLNDVMRWSSDGTVKNTLANIKDGILMFRDRLDEFIVDVQEEQDEA